MLRFIVAMAILAACGTSDDELPTAPFASEPRGQLIHFASPIETATTDHKPGNLYDRASVPAGLTRFTWTPVEGADTYQLILNDISALSPGSAVLDFSTYAHAETSDTTTEVELRDAFDDGYPLALAIQVFAYRDSELIGMSAMWALEASPVP